jgi:hypothetical protein
MNEFRKSDSPEIPVKSPNKAGQPAAEGAEERGLGQREPAPAKRAPDTEPGRRAQCAGAGTSGSS